MEFQARVKNATTISEIAKQNYDADVQIALENARMAQSVDIANLNAEIVLLWKTLFPTIET